MMNVSADKGELKYMCDNYYQDFMTMVLKGFFIELVKIQCLFITIDFSKNNFNGEIPSSIGKLNLLKGLNFSHNNLIGPLPSSLGNLTNLEWLDLSRNNLSERIPSLICNITSLNILDLSHNHLSNMVPLCLGNFSDSLTVLDLRSNKFNGTIPATFTKGNYLRSLNLNDN